MNFYYEISIWMAPTWQPFEDLLAKMFLKPSLKLAAKCHCSRYVAKQRGLAALILLSKVVGFFGSKVSYICLLYPTGCDICSDEIFLKTTTLMWHNNISYNYDSITNKQNYKSVLLLSWMGHFKSMLLLHNHELILLST